MNKTILRMFGPALALVIAATVAQAGEIMGTIRAGGQPLPGALVTAQTKSGIDITVYAAKDGTFRLKNLPAGPYAIRARAPGFEEMTAIADEGASLDLQLHAAVNPLLVAPSSTFLSLLPDGAMKRRFIMVCTTCHEFSHTRIWKDGAVRNVAKWTDAIELMKKIDAYAMIPPDLKTAQYAYWLATNLSPERLASLKPPAAADPAIVDGATITEYPLPNKDELPHDVVIGPDGRIWITGFWHNEVLAMDPKTGVMETYPVTTNSTPAAQVRALEFDRKGRLWIVLGGTKSVVRLDTKTGKFHTYPVGMYAHDLVIDSRGNIWINDYFSNPGRIARLSATTGKVTYFRLPSSNMTASEGLPLPYGLAIDAKDRLWSTQLAGNTLVRFDTRTMRAKLYRMPEPDSGPRRNAIGIDGSVWIPEFNDGYLARFDPNTETFKRYNLGDSALGAYEVAVDPRTGAVWITGSLTSSLLRFDPKTGAIEHYPLPTEPAYMRKISIDARTGAVWSAYSSLPAVVPKVVRLMPGR